MPHGLREARCPEYRGRMYLLRWLGLAAALAPAGCAVSYHTYQGRASQQDATFTRSEGGGVGTDTDAPATIATSAKHSTIDVAWQPHIGTLILELGAALGFEATDVI